MKKFCAFIVLTLTTLSVYAKANVESYNWEDYKRYVIAHLGEIHGWCTPEKATRMMDLIYTTHPKACVEVGVFGGSSVYPTAQALKRMNEGGVIYAIDSWKKDDCVVGYTPGDANYNWWATVDLNAIYQSFISMINRFDLKNQCVVMRTTSEQAVLSFGDETIDIIHIDGNHTAEQALADVKMWFPKVRHGGYIWFDDANWSSTQLAVQFMLEHCQLDPSSHLTDHYLLFQKR